MAREMITIETGGAVEVQALEKTFDNVVDEWLTFLANKSAKRKRSALPRTIENYRYSINVFKRWLDEQNVAIGQATEDTIAAWCNSMDTAKFSDATKNAYLAAVRSFFKWAHEAYGATNIAAGFGCWERSREHTRGFLSLAEMKELLDTVEVVTKDKLSTAKNKSQRDRINLQCKRDRAILTVLMCGALRTIEVSRLRVGDLVRDGGCFMLSVQGKGKTETNRVTVKISGKARRVIREWLDAREAVDIVSDDSPLFCSLGNNSFGEPITSMSVSRLCKEYLRAAGLKEKKFVTDDKKVVVKPIVAHSLRASCATNAFRSGAKLEQVQQQLRHVHLATTQIYLFEAEKLSNPVSDIISDAVL